jgi:hypothetical protein
VVTKGEWRKDGNLYEVETGRRDGRVSSAKEAAVHLPDSFDGILKLIARFKSKGLGLKDLAVLSGKIVEYSRSYMLQVSLAESPWKQHIQIVVARD